MSSDTAMEPIVFEPVGEHEYTVIFVHGLGDSAETWTVPVESWRRNGEMDNVKFVLPNAPSIPITANSGTEMPAWFDIKVFDGTAEALRDNEDANGIDRSKEYFQELIRKEVDEAGLDSERILIGGFSQGGALSVLSGLTSDYKLAGIVCLSSWLLHPDEFEDLVPDDKPNADTPIFMGHGIDDRMVTPAMGKESYDSLKSMGYSVSWEVYPDMGHSTCVEELEDVESFVEDNLVV